MELKNMEMDKKETKEAMMPVPSDAKYMPQYPYGLCLNLGNDSLEKLDIPLPAVGSELILMTKVKVVSASMQENQNKEKNMSAGLQITDMALEPVKNRKETSKILYES
jgi:hypothetical protein